MKHQRKVTITLDCDREFLDILQKEIQTILHEAQVPAWAIHIDAFHSERERTMNIKNRILCFLKGHFYTVYIQVNSIEVNVECDRCGNMQSPYEARKYLSRCTIPNDIVEKEQ